tara:strand:+ start:501 stop:713 length:213 start_codon:yes stop_codon:yes gene_type:complete
MNNTINEINKLQKITDTISKNIPWNLHVASCLDGLRDLIKEKQKEVSQFELDNMSFEQYKEHMKGRGFDA